MLKSPTQIRENILNFLIFFTISLGSITFIWKFSRISYNINLIHFVDTSQNVNDPFTSRQACAIESAAMTNPYHEVHLWFTSESRFVEIIKSSELLRKLSASYKNIEISYVKLEDLSKGSPIEELIQSGVLASSKYILEHTSDVSRLLLLWKYGGTYFDTDVIIQKSLQEFPRNFACQQDQDLVNGAILRIEDHNISDYLIRYLNDHFDGNKFVTNGPLVVTKVMLDLCGEQDLIGISEESCEGFHLISKKYCYEIGYPEWKKFFDPKHSDEVMRRTEESLAVHFWNYLSKNMTLEIKSFSYSAYIRKAKLFCPKVILMSGKYF